MRKVIVLLLIISLLICTSYASNVFSAAVDEKTAQVGDTVKLTVSLDNNTGILAMLLKLTYDSQRLELVSAESTGLVPGAVFSESFDAYPYTMLWNSASAKDYEENGALAILTFKVLDGAEAGMAYVNLSYQQNDVYNADLEDVALSVKNGGVHVSNGDKVQEVTPNVDKEPEAKMVEPAAEAEADAGSVEPPEAGDNAAMETIQLSRPEMVLTVGEKSAVVFGQLKTNDVAPIIRNGRTMLPARFVAENLGASVQWDNSERKVTITKEETEIILFIDSDLAYLNGEQVTLDSPAFIENDRTYTPVRFIAESLGATVNWLPETKQVMITP